MVKTYKEKVAYKPAVGKRYYWHSYDLVMDLDVFFEGIIFSYIVLHSSRQEARKLNTKVDIYNFLKLFLLKSFVLFIQLKTDRDSPSTN